MLFRTDLVLVCFGTKSPEDQKVAIDLLATKLKENARTKFRLPSIFEEGKKNKDLYCDLAAAVERKRWINLSTHEMYKALDLPVFRDNEKFVQRVGLSIWTKFDQMGSKDFNTLVLPKMQNRSKDELMWAGLIYQLDVDETVKTSFIGLFNDLLQS